MIIGVPRETKSDEYRVSLIPAGVETLVRAGHRILIEHHAGQGSGISDAQYQAVGAHIIPTATEVWQEAQLIVKVKEPQSAEYPLLKPNQIVLTFFHFAADKNLVEACLAARITAIAYETIRDKRGHLPCLTPMSEIAGKMSIQQGAKYLERPTLGRGILLGGVPGVPPANVAILGAGVVGYHAAQVAAGMGAKVKLLDINLDRLRQLADVLPPNVTTIFSDPHTLHATLIDADLVIGAVLIPGARAPRLITADDFKLMQPGSVIVDVAIDQGGCVATSHPTTHKDPVYLVDNIVHYCVANIPGAVPRTSTFALCNATFPYVLQLANKGYERATHDDPGLAAGLCMHNGQNLMQSD